MVRILKKLKKRKMFLAVLTAMCCLITATIPAVADDETADTETTAEDTTDTSTDEEAEDEATRTEEVEEIEITADQVEQYMDEMNSAEGITFYYRPEDYEDTITDENVVDLLDDIELAGIDDETGEVVCTLEEEDDTNDFVIFLSVRGIHITVGSFISVGSRNAQLII